MSIPNISIVEDDRETRPPCRAYFLYPRHRQTMPKLHAFIDHVKGGVAGKGGIGGDDRRTGRGRKV